ncbi:DUF2125 domain-containing protein [Cereibacter changlensis]|uniref:DUF2125 domain-containing protein n=1 Tax=Cereibacter changlensis TaxID=402884 RepID=UPI004034AA2B
MRAVLTLVLVAAVLWGGYWFVGSRALERSAEAWFASQAAQGRIAERESLNVAGFPSRFDLTVTEPHLEDPVSGFGWRAPFAQVFSLTYKPWHVITALPNTQTILAPGQQITLDSTRLRGSLIVKPSPALALDRIAIAGEGLAARSSLGWTVAASAARFATRQIDDDPARHEIGLDITALAPDASLLAAATEAELPEVIDSVKLSAILGFTAPLDRHAGETRPELASLDLNETLIAWGDLKLFASGGLTVQDGLPEGRIDFRLENWRKAIRLAVALELIKPEVAPTWERMLGIMAAQSADAEKLDVPLIFADGRMSLGPLPLGPAPRLAQRQ